MNKDYHRAPVERTVKLDRNRDIASKILKCGLTIKDAANIHEIGHARARQILHQFCRKANPCLYRSLLHSNTYAGGWTNDECLPLLKLLREHADIFLMPSAKSESNYQRDCQPIEQPKHSYSIERLHHFNCSHCSKWWAIGDYETTHTLTCPYCATTSELKELESTLNAYLNMAKQVLANGKPMVVSEYFDEGESQHFEITIRAWWQNENTKT